MAKIRTEITLPPELVYYVTAVHWGDYGAWGANVIHAIWPYQAMELYPGVSAYHIHDTAESAALEAEDWVRLPALVRDICLLCRQLAPGPGIPRWNIYRGEEREHAPPCILWDSWTGPPPWP